MEEVMFVPFRGGRQQFAFQQESAIDLNLFFIYKLEVWQGSMERA